MEFRVGEGRVAVNMGSQAEVLAAMEERLRRAEGFAVATLNLDHLVKLRADPAFRRAYARQDLVTADGNPVVWLSRLGGRPVGLVPGSDLLRPALALCARLHAPVAFLGSTEASLQAAARALAAEVPGLEVRAAVAPPMGFDPEGAGARDILRHLDASGVRLVVLALGAPKQERLAALGREVAPRLGFLSAGAALDFESGRQRRAPPLARALALEWLWRAAGDPRRLAGRYARCAAILPGLALRAAGARLRRP